MRSEPEALKDGRVRWCGPGFIRCAQPSQTVSALRVTIPRAITNERLAGGSRSRVPYPSSKGQVAMLTLLRLPF